MRLRHGRRTDPETIEPAGGARVKSWLWALAAFAFLAAAPAGCAQKRLFQPEVFRPVEIDVTGYTARVDTFIIVFDVSYWMGDNYRRARDTERVREIAARMLRTVPPLGFRAGLVASGTGTCLGCEDARPILGPASYTTADLEAALAVVGRPGSLGRLGPLSETIDIRRTDAEERLGRVAMIVVCDAHDYSLSRTFKHAQKMKAALGGRLCIYPVQVGRDPEGAELMRVLSRIGGCGFAVNAEDIASPRAMADYVTQVLLAPAADPAGGGPAALE
jgi:OOP family OmpA-OmpF porin